MNPDNLSLYFLVSLSIRHEMTPFFTENSKSMRAIAVDNICKTPVILQYVLALGCLAHFSLSIQQYY